MFKYLVQQVTQKQLAKSLVATSEVARLYRTLTSKEHIHSVAEFLKFGLQPNVVVFDALLKHALEKLLKVYRIFLLFEPAGYLLREQRMDIIAEAFDVSATIIQTALRRKFARKRVAIVRAKHNEEQAKQDMYKSNRKRLASRY